MDEQVLRVERDADIAEARRAAREITALAGFNREDAEAVVLAVLELATNLVRYARQGELLLTQITGERGVGIQVESRDMGPGIPDLARAMQDGFSTGGGLGSGLPAVRRLMDEFTITSAPAGTRVVARKWLKH